MRLQYSRVRWVTFMLFSASQKAMQLEWPWDIIPVKGFFTEVRRKDVTSWIKWQTVPCPECRDGSHKCCNHFPTVKVKVTPGGRSGKMDRPLVLDISALTHLSKIFQLWLVTERSKALTYAGILHYGELSAILNVNPRFGLYNRRGNSEVSCLFCQPVFASSSASNVRSPGQLVGFDFEMTRPDFTWAPCSWKRSPQPSHSSKPLPTIWLS